MVELRVAGRQGDRILERALGQVALAAHPVEVGKRLARTCGIRIQLDGLAERLLGLREVAPGGLEVAEIRVGKASLGVDLEGGLHVRHGRVQILQARQRVAAEQAPVHAGRFEGQDLVRPHAGVLELPRREVHDPGLELGVGICGQQIGSAEVLAIGPLPVPGLRQRLSQLEPRLAEARILLYRIAILDDCFIHQALCQIGVGALEVLAFGDAGIPRAADGETSE
jgi:hypothetical protein